MRAAIPATGRDHKAILEEMSGMSSQDADWKSGRTWSMVYYAGKAHHDFLKRAHNLYFAENALNPMAFQSLKRMEAEVVQMTATMLHGPETAVGTMTSGGTESILMAVKAARDRARAKKPWIRTPNIVAPKTIHVAFDKAAHYFGLKVRYVAVDKDFRADIKALKKAITRNTVLVAASAPQYPHGVVDPIEEIATIAEKKKIPFHVDGCFGGFMLPWLEANGCAIPTWDFRIPGVTSISADVHKYGYAAKGASTVIYRDMSYLKHQFFVSTDWPGGIYASPSMPGTRPGGTIAAAWAALQTMGEDGYKKLAKQAWDASCKLREGVEKINGLKALGPHHSTVVTWGADEDGENEIDIYAVADVMESKGWSIDRQQNPASVHCTVNANQLKVVSHYLSDLEEAVETVRNNPELNREGTAPMYGLMAKVPIRGLVKSSVVKVMEDMYGPSGGVPDLSKLGAGQDDGMILEFIHKYGDHFLDAMDYLKKLRRSIFGGGR